MSSWGIGVGQTSLSLCSFFLHGVSGQAVLGYWYMLGRCPLPSAVILNLQTPLEF